MTQYDILDLDLLVIKPYFYVSFSTYAISLHETNQTGIIVSPLVYVYMLVCVINQIDNNVDIAHLIILKKSLSQFTKSYDFLFFNFPYSVRGSPKVQLYKIT